MNTANDLIQDSHDHLIAAAQFPIANEKALAHYAAAQTKATVAQAMLAHNDTAQRKLIDKWEGIRQRFYDSGNLEYSIAVQDCMNDLQEILRNNG